MLLVIMERAEKGKIMDFDLKKRKAPPHSGQINVANFFCMMRMLI